MPRRGLLAAPLALLVAASCWGRSPTSSERSAIRAAVIAYFETDAAIGRLPQDLDARQAAINDPLRRKQRDAQLVAVIDPEVADARVAEFERALAGVASDATYNAYTRSRFVVEEWRSIRVRGSRATASLEGHMRYDGEKADTEVTHVDLVHRAGTWLVHATKVTSYPYGSG